MPCKCSDTHCKKYSVGYCKDRCNTKEYFYEKDYFNNDIKFFKSYNGDLFCKYDGRIHKLKFDGDDSCNDCCCPQPVKGERGPQGLKGDKGEQGDQGLTGVQGVQGLHGVQGLQGLQGVQGSKGDQGPEGDQGVQGEKGDMPEIPEFPIKMAENNALSVDQIRDIPSNGLCQLFFNKQTNEISVDTVVPSYSDLIETVKRLEQELADLKSQN